MEEDVQLWTAGICLSPAGVGHSMASALNSCHTPVSSTTNPCKRKSQIQMMVRIHCEDGGTDFADWTNKKSRKVLARSCLQGKRQARLQSFGMCNSCNVHHHVNCSRNAAAAFPSQDPCYAHHTIQHRHTGGSVCLKLAPVQILVLASTNALTYSQSTATGLDDNACHDAAVAEIKACLVMHKSGN